MKITRSPQLTAPGPEASFTGQVFIDTVATPEATARTSAGRLG